MLNNLTYKIFDLLLLHVKTSHKMRNAYIFCNNRYLFITSYNIVILIIDISENLNYINMIFQSRISHILPELFSWKDKALIIFQFL